MVKLSTGVYPWRCVKRLRKRKSVVTEVILLNLMLYSVVSEVEKAYYYIYQW